MTPSMELAAIRCMSNSPASPGEHPPAPDSAAPAKSKGWPLWLRILLAVVVLSFVWSPFLAMLMRLSRVNPGLQPTGGTPDLVPPPEAPPAASRPSLPTPPGRMASPAMPSPRP